MLTKLEKGARQAVRNCMKIKKTDAVIIVTDRKTEQISSSIKKECEKITSAVTQFILEDFGNRPLKKLPVEIKKAVSKSTAIFYMAKSLPGEKSSLRMPIVKYGVQEGRARQAHMPDISKEIMEQGMNTDYNKVKKLSKRLYNLVSKARKIKITTKKGTDFTATFNDKWKWVIADGDIPNSSTGWSNLPDGEVFTAPLEINGRAVIDGCLGDYFISLGKLKTPVILEIRKNRVVSIESKNKKLEKELKKYIRQDKNASRIGEFAIGTNLGLKNIIGNLLQDEKFPGVHIAMGDCYPKETLAPYPSKAHLDGVIQKTTIFVDGRLIMRNGKFLI